MNQIETTFGAILDSCQPESIFTMEFSDSDCAKTIEPFISKWHQQHNKIQWQHTQLETSSWQHEFLQVIDFALIYNVLEHLSRKDGLQILAQLRNYGTRQIAVTVEDHSSWSLNDFISLGFRKHAHIAPSETLDRGYDLYTYNLSNYNHKRTWNNPRFWANPEMWNKSRW